MQSNNVVSLAQWRGIKSHKNRVVSIIDTFKDLSFGALIQKTRDLISKLEHDQLRLEMVEEGLAILQEYKNRCFDTNSELTEILDTMASELKSQLNKIGLSV